MKTSNCIASLLLLFWLFLFSTEARKTARHNKNKRHMYGYNYVHNNLTDGAFLTVPLVFNILGFGAKADGVSDDSQALFAAWTAACFVYGGVVMIPSGYSFMMKPVTLHGPCMPNLVLQIDGTILAPPISGWPRNSLYQWMNFKWLHNFSIQGTGTVDGQGSNWWPPSLINKRKRGRKIPGKKPTALRFYASCNVTVSGIRIVNSPWCHLKFDNSKGVIVENVTISAPENSPNTDGIHLQNSQDVQIMHSDIGTGDDCVSIQTGCSNVHVHNINCGPGHGISLGGLGKDHSTACVSNIVVENITMQNTMYGARIKTWQGGLGSVRNVTFMNIQVSEVNVPIIIDQFYCDKKSCKNQTGAVAISGVTFGRIIGTYSSQPIRLACSDSVPCTDVNLTSIELVPSSLNCSRIQQGMCTNTYGKSSEPLVPESMGDCLRSSNGSKLVERRMMEISRSVGCW